MFKRVFDCIESLSRILKPLLRLEILFRLSVFVCLNVCWSVCVCVYLCVSTCVGVRVSRCKISASRRCCIVVSNLVISLIFELMAKPIAHRGLFTLPPSTEDET